MHQFTSRSGKLIHLRPPTLDDVQLMLDYINTIGHEDIYVNVNPQDLYTYEQELYFVKDIINRIDQKKAIYYLAFDQDTLVGSCSVFKQDKRKRHLGLFGITLNKAYRGDGIGHRLSQIVIQDAASILDLNTVILEVFEPNRNAYRLYQKLGFVEYGHLPEGLSYKNSFVDSLLMYKKIPDR